MPGGQLTPVSIRGQIKGSGGMRPLNLQMFKAAPKNLLTDAQHAAPDQMWEALDGNAILCNQSQAQGFTSGVFQVSSQEHLQQLTDVAVAMGGDPTNFSGSDFPEMKVYIKADSNARVVGLRLHTGWAFTEKFDVD
jgi:hypothetical protein